MVQDAEEGHGNDGETIEKNWTIKNLAECTTTARHRKRWGELVHRSVVSDLHQ